MIRLLSFLCDDLLTILRLISKDLLIYSFAKVLISNRLGKFGVN